MRITTRKVYFIISEEEAGPKRPLVWCELPVNFYFKEYNVVGVKEQYNEIYLEFSTGVYLFCTCSLFFSINLNIIQISVLLARSLTILKQEVKHCKIKLTDKDSPCLTLEMELVW